MIVKVRSSRHESGSSTWERTSMFVTMKWIRLAPVALLALWVAQPASAQKKDTDGVFVTVQNPINEGQITRIKAEVDGARNLPNRNVKVVVFDFNPEGREAATETFGACIDLATYIRSLSSNAIRRVA